MSDYAAHVGIEFMEQEALLALAEGRGTTHFDYSGLWIWPRRNCLAHSSTHTSVVRPSVSQKHSLRRVKAILKHRMSFATVWLQLLVSLSVPPVAVWNDVQTEWDYSLGSAGILPCA